MTADEGVFESYTADRLSGQTLGMRIDLQFGSTKVSGCLVGVEHRCDELNYSPMILDAQLQPIPSGQTVAITVEGLTAFDVPVSTIVRIYR